MYVKLEAHDAPGVRMVIELDVLVFFWIGRERTGPGLRAPMHGFIAC